MLMTAFLLFVVTKGELPTLTALGSYPDAPSCQVAMTAIKDALNGGGSRQDIVCISTQSLEDMAKANDLQGQVGPVEPDE